MDVDTDGRELLARSLAGDREALAQLYRRYQPVVFGFLLHQHGVSNCHDLEDVTQQVFLSMLSASEPADAPNVSACDGQRRRDDGAATTSLVRLAERLVGNQRRADRRRRLREVGPWVPPIDDDAMAALERRERQSEVRRAVAELPADQRQAIELVCLRSVTLSEAALMIGSSPEAVRGRCRRAKQRLAKMLGHMAVEGRDSVAERK